MPPPPLDPYVTASELQNPYPYDPQKAVALLSSHGWKGPTQWGHDRSAGRHRA